MKKHGGRRPGAGRPKQPTVRDVALALSRPSGKPSVGSARNVRLDNQYVSAAYRPSKASARRSAIPAAAMRARLQDVLAGRGLRSLSSIEMQFADILDAQCANTKTTSNCRELHMPTPENALVAHARRAPLNDEKHRPSDPARQTLADCGLDSVLHVDSNRSIPGREPGASIGDFLFEDFYDGTKQPGELRGIKRTER